MYVCICNALTDKQVISAIARGCAKPSEIYSNYETAPRCGKCAIKMNELIARQNPTHGGALAAFSGLATDLLLQEIFQADFLD